MPPVTVWLGQDTSSPSSGTLPCSGVKRESLSPLNRWVFLLHPLLSFCFFIIEVRFVFIADCLSLDWTDLLSKIIQCPITNVVDASSIAVTPRQRGEAQRDKSPFQEGPVMFPSTHCSFQCSAKEEMLRRSRQAEAEAAYLWSNRAVN